METINLTLKGVVLGILKALDQTEGIALHVLHDSLK